MANRRKDSQPQSDAGLRDAARTPSQSGSAGGETARDVGSRDEERTANGADAAITRVRKRDKIQPATATRSDHRGAAR
jgi:hypothetical protein